MTAVFPKNPEARPGLHWGSSISKLPKNQRWGRREGKDLALCAAGGPAPLSRLGPPVKTNLDLGCPSIKRRLL